MKERVHLPNALLPSGIVLSQFGILKSAVLFIPVGVVATEHLQKETRVSAAGDRVVVLGAEKEFGVGTAPSAEVRGVRIIFTFFAPILEGLLSPLPVVLIGIFQLLVQFLALQLLLRGFFSLGLKLVS